MQETLDLCSEKYRNAGIEQIIDIETGVGLQCCKVQIQQVLLNLLSNAYDAAIAAKVNRPWIKISGRLIGDKIEIEVIDCGNGIPTEHRDKLFQPFFTTKAIGSGTGLGLSISKGIIESHHGTLNLDPSCANTAFSIRLPQLQQ